MYETYLTFLSSLLYCLHGSKVSKYEEKICQYLIKRNARKLLNFWLWGIASHVTLTIPVQIWQWAFTAWKLECMPLLLIVEFLCQTNLVRSLAQMSCQIYDKMKRAFFIKYLESFYHSKQCLVEVGSEGHLNFVSSQVTTCEESIPGFLLF